MAELWPELATLNLERLTSGSIVRYGAQDAWCVEYRAPFLVDKAVIPTEAEIRAWFELGDGVDVAEEAS